MIDKAIPVICGLNANVGVPNVNVGILDVNFGVPDVKFGVHDVKFWVPDAKVGVFDYFLLLFFKKQPLHYSIFQTLSVLSIFIKNLSMQFSEKRNFTRWIIIMASFVIVVLILWNTYSFFQIFK